MIIPKDRNTNYPLNYKVETTARMVKSSINNTTTFAIPEPFGNCQTFAIGYANNIFANNLKPRLNNREIPEYDYYDIALDFIKYKLCAGKLQVIIDIKANYEYTKIINTIFANHIVIEAPYTSTNTSQMCIYLLRIQGAVDYVSKIDKYRREKEQEELEKYILDTGSIPEFKLPTYWYVRMDTKEQYDLLARFYPKRRICFGIGYHYVGENDSNFITTVGKFATLPIELEGFTEISFSDWKSFVAKKEEPIAYITPAPSELPF